MNGSRVRPMVHTAQCGHRRKVIAGDEEFRKQPFSDYIRAYPALWVKIQKGASQWQSTMKDVGPFLPSEPRATRRKGRQRSTSMVRKRAKNLRTTKRVCVPGIFSVSPTMPALISTKRHSRKGSPRRKPSAFPDRKAKPKSKIGRI